jgi:hypothetical protein
MSDLVVPKQDKWKELVYRHKESFNHFLSDFMQKANPVFLESVNFAPEHIQLDCFLMEMLLHSSFQSYEDVLKVLRLHAMNTILSKNDYMDVLKRRKLC